MTQDDSQFRLRIPLSLKLKLEGAAKAEGRSINAQVLHCIEKYFETDEMADLQNMSADHETRIRDLERRMEDVYHMSGWRDYPGNESA